jgi:beta-lactamase superfamily II metal-dependent hydrolase
MYGHPVPYVLDRYHREGAQIFRTDRDGQIELSTDGEAVAVRTFTGRDWRGERAEPKDQHEDTKGTKGTK